MQMQFKDWIPIISLIIMVATILVGLGMVRGQIEENTRRIDALTAIKPQMDVLSVQIANLGADIRYTKETVSDLRVQYHKIDERLIEVSQKVTSLEAKR